MLLNLFLILGATWFATGCVSATPIPEDGKRVASAIIVAIGFLVAVFVLVRAYG